MNTLINSDTVTYIVTMDHLLELSLVFNLVLNHLQELSLVFKQLETSKEKLNGGLKETRELFL